MVVYICSGKHKPAFPWLSHLQIMTYTLTCATPKFVHINLFLYVPFVFLILPGTGVTMQANPSYTAVEEGEALEPNPCYSAVQANSGYEPISGLCILLSLDDLML